MSSTSGDESEVGGANNEAEEVQSLEVRGNGAADNDHGSEASSTDGPSDIVDILGDEGVKANEDSASANGNVFHGYGKAKDAAAQRPGIDRRKAMAIALQRPASPGESVSTPDDTPSIQGSVLSSPGGTLSASQFSFSRPSLGGHAASLQPFDRRFQSRLSSAPLQSPRALSPAFLAPHSRQSSLSSQLILKEDESETPQAPWEVVRWTKLKKLSGQVFSESGKRNFGRATCLAVSASIVIGTSKGHILVFDYNQTLKSIIGPGTKAAESGAITSLAISSDYSTVAGGHANGNIFTWELARPAKPFLQIPPLDKSQLASRRGDSHISGRAILHVGFLGTRHTALVSADDGGMAFSHLATRGLGAVGRTIKTTRILGRYPELAGSPEKPRKPSSVLAFSPLPFGNVEQATDNMGLTALLTPYLLVIVSTTPIAQTQHKSSRPKEVAPHSTLSGSLAWFPAVKLKKAPGSGADTFSKTKLVYCWSNILTVLEVDIVQAGQAAEKEKPAELHFRARSRYRSDEAIVAVQWLSRSVLGVLTVSQRLLILEDPSLRVTDTFDLIHKHILHQDLFSKQLQPVVEELDEDDVSMHGVVADGFHMSFKAYKGRLFMLGFQDVSIGTLSNWADRLIALMEEGDYLTAIGLATSYYNGDAEKLTVGLPDDDEARHALVREKLLEMISASLKFTFSRLENKEAAARNTEVKELADACFTACMSMQELEFLFEDVYEQFEDASMERIFLITLEPYILEGEITELPPAVLKALITQYTGQGQGSRLEEMICRLDTQSMDIDQVTTLCKQHMLYEALIYVWNEALGDYITPLTDLLDLIKIVGYDKESNDAVKDLYYGSAMKIFPYLAYLLTGRVYPTANPKQPLQAYKARKDLYNFVFSGRATEVNGQRYLSQTDDGPEPTFPYLRMLLRFDAASVMSMLNEAFEDSFLNGGSDEAVNGNGETNDRRKSQTGVSPTRQYIITILLEVMSSGFETEDTIYLDMFIARNLPKFPQFILLSGSALRKVLVGLCNYPSDEVAEDCQLSAEYLLSMYHPSDIRSIIPLLKEAGFHRVLKSVYRTEKQYADLLEACFDDVENHDAIFDCIGDCLRPKAGLSKKQIQDVKTVIKQHGAELVSINTIQTARTLQSYAPDLLDDILEAMDDGSQAQFLFLRTLLEPERLHLVDSLQSTTPAASTFTERYVRLMCRYDPMHVADYVSLLKSGDLRLDHVLPALESSGVVDAAVVLMARDGLVRNAMDRLIKHLGTLETALTSLIEAAAESPDASNTAETADDLLDAIQKYTKVGVWLCNGQTRSVQRPTPFRQKSTRTKARTTEADLSPAEILWVDLLDGIIGLTKTISTAAQQLQQTPSSESLAIPPHLTVNAERITTTLRTNVQNTFTALLTTTSTVTHPSTTPVSPTIPATQPHDHDSDTFLPILLTLLTRLSRSCPTLSDLRSVLSSIFAAYTFEETLLSLSNRLLDADVFVNVAEAKELRQKGWRPRGTVCEGCRRRVWGPGVGRGVWDAWEERERAEEERRRRRWRGEAAAEEDQKGKGKGKGKSAPSGASSGGTDGEEETSTTEDSLGPLVVFACRHMWHRKCLEEAKGDLVQQDGTDRERRGMSNLEYRCPLEP